MKILVAVDFSDITNPVVRTAKRLIQAHGGEILLLHAVSPVFFIPYPESIDAGIVDVEVLKEIEEARVKEAKEKIKGLEEFLKGLNVRSVIEVGDPREVILEVEEREKPDLLLMGSHKKGIVERILVGSTAEKVIKHSKVPTLVLKGKEPSFEGKVVVAYDFSEASHKALDFALEFLKPFSSEITIIHVDERLELPLIEQLGERVYERYKEEKERYLSKLRGELSDKGVEAEIKIIEGVHPAEGILNFVKTVDADLLIMGSKGLSGLKRILLGSTSTEVFRKAEVPVLIYKHD